METVPCGAQKPPHQDALTRPDSYFPHPWNSSRG